MTSAIRRLLDELSWEGNAKKYRGGGAGKENVLTTEVFQALDFLPRTHFLGPVLAEANAGNTQQYSPPLDIEDVVFDILPGDISAGSLRVQPDVVLSSPSHFILVEAKAPHGGSFQLEQLGRELLLAGAHAAGRQATLLLVLGSPPPVPVKGRGRLSVDEAIGVGLSLVASRGDHRDSVLPTTATVAWTTWALIGEQVERGIESYRADDPSTHRAVMRLAHSLLDAVQVHSARRPPARRPNPG